MLDESWDVETVVVVADEDDDNEWLDDKSIDDDDTGAEVDASGDTDSVDCDVGCSMLDEWCDGEPVVVVADGDGDNDWLEDKSNNDDDDADDDDRGYEADRLGDTDPIDSDGGSSMLDEWCDGETVVVVPDGDDDNDWLEDKSNDDDDDDDDADDDDSGSEVDRLGDTDSVDSDGGSSMLDESWAVETVVVVADEDDDNDWLENKSNEEDDTGTEVDTSGDTESIDTDVSWRMLEESCTEETVILDADEDEENDWLEDK